VEGEARPPEDDAERRDAERDEQRGHHGLEGDREARPQHHEHEDEPHVVRLPDRADGPVDERASTAAALAGAGEQPPEPTAEIGAAEDRVERGSDPQHAGDGIGGAHDDPSLAGGTGSLGP
jgi:hypothetical protein